MELKELTRWGFIEREQYPVIPPKTEYKLTKKGQTLKPVMAAMAAWGLQHRQSLIE
jgi:DNA-binding HxlR family transcriptional regulator